jgi:hypothetical protein
VNENENASSAIAMALEVQAKRRFMSDFMVYSGDT